VKFAAIVAVATASVLGLSFWLAETIVLRRNDRGDALGKAHDDLEADKVRLAQYRKTGERGH
jgi:hypothetical protein